MKKIIYSIIAFATLIVVSCSNEDIYIEKKLHGASVKCNINIIELYNTFGVTEKLPELFLRDKSGAIAVAAYLYDANGNAVDSTLQTSFTTSALSLSFDNVVSGNYTLVAIETLVNPDDKNQSDSWRFVGSKKLSTLAVKQINAKSTPYDAVGVGTVNLLVNDKDQSINITPKPLGSRINFYSYNINNFEVVNIGFGTTDILDRYKLDPMMRESDRYVVDLSQKGKFNLRCSLTKEKILNGYYNLSYVIEDAIEWRPCFQNETNAGTSTWNLPSEPSTKTLENGKTYFAVLYYLDKLGSYVWGMYESHEEMMEFVETCEEYNVSPTPSSVLYDAPYTKWNVGTVSAVRSYMSKYSLVQDLSESSDGNYLMMYQDPTNSAYYMYVFTNSSSGLTDSYVLLDGASVTLDKVKTHLTNQENYKYLGSEDGNDFYSNETTSVMVWLSDNGFLYVNYYDPAAYTSVVQRRAKAMAGHVENFSPSYTIKPARAIVSMQTTSNCTKRESLLIEKKK